MASVSVVDQERHYFFEVWVDDLENPANQYDKFVFRVCQNGICIIRATMAGNKFGDSHIAGLYFDNSSYLGYNWLSPGCTYQVYVDCYWEGVCYTVGPDTFTTPSISFTSSVTNITPSVYVPVRNQGEYNTCVADSLACAMEIFREKNMGVEYERFSTAYIFGGEGYLNGNDSEYGMNFSDAIDFCGSYGSPRYEIFSGLMPDSMTKSEAISLYKELKDTKFITDNAKKQRFYNADNVDFYDYKTIISYLQVDGCFMFNFRVPWNFYDVGTDGIVPQPDEYSDTNHSMVLIGLTKKNNKMYWIAQNSWGEDWGNNGRCYVPFNWGCGVQAPVTNSKEPTSWTMDCYAVSAGTGFYESGPSAVTNLKVIQVNGAMQVQLTWGSNETSAEYIVLARQGGTDKWYYKKTVTNTSATIDVDKYMDYEFIVLTMKNSHCSAQSSIARVTVIKPPDLILADLSVERGDASLTFTWNGADAATGYNIVLTRNWDGTTYSPTSVNVKDKICVFENLGYGVTHTFSIQPYNSSESAEPTTATVTTSPARLQIEFYQIVEDMGIDDRKIGVECYCWTDVETNCTSIEMTYYDQEGYWYGYYDPYVGYTQWPSANETCYDYDFQHDQIHKVEVRIRLQVPDDELGMDSFANAIYGPITEAYLTIITQKPSLWEWTSPMTGRLIVDENKEVHPVMADEWNDFLDKIYQTFWYMSVILDMWVDWDEFPYVEPRQEITCFRYNVAVTRIRYLIEALETNTGITIEKPSTIRASYQEKTFVSASFFTVLRDALNNVINSLD